MNNLHMIFEKAIDKAKVVSIYDIYHLIEHTGYHLGQVVDRGVRVTGKRFNILFFRLIVIWCI